MKCDGIKGRASIVCFISVNDFVYTVNNSPNYESCILRPILSKICSRINRLKRALKIKMYEKHHHCNNINNFPNTVSEKIFLIRYKNYV